MGKSECELEGLLDEKASITNLFLLGLKLVTEGHFVFRVTSLGKFGLLGQLDIFVVDLLVEDLNQGSCVRKGHLIYPELPALDFVGILACLSCALGETLRSQQLVRFWLICYLCNSVGATVARCRLGFFGMNLLAPFVCQLTELNEDLRYPVLQLQLDDVLELLNFQLFTSNEDVHLGLFVVFTQSLINNFDKGVSTQTYVDISPFRKCQLLLSMLPEDKALNTLTDFQVIDKLWLEEPLEEMFVWCGVLTPLHKVHHTYLPLHCGDWVVCEPGERDGFIDLLLQVLHPFGPVLVW